MDGATQNQTETLVAEGLTPAVQVPAGATVTKDLAILTGPDQKWLTTNQFLDKLDEGLQKVMAREHAGAA